MEADASEKVVGDSEFVKAVNPDISKGGTNGLN